MFGRGGEEALACAAAGVDFDVVPGISSAIAVPAYAGIPGDPPRHHPRRRRALRSPRPGRPGIAGPLAGPRRERRHPRRADGPLDPRRALQRPSSGTAARPAHLPPPSRVAPPPPSGSWSAISSTWPAQSRTRTCPRRSSPSSATSSGCASRCAGTQRKQRRAHDAGRCTRSRPRAMRSCGREPTRRPCPPLTRAVVERVIHASADLGYRDDLVCDEPSLQAGHEALAARRARSSATSRWSRPASPGQRPVPGSTIPRSPQWQPIWGSPARRPPYASPSRRSVPARSGSSAARPRRCSS